MSDQSLLKSTPARNAPGLGLGQIADARILTMLVVFAVLAIAFHVESGGIFFTPRNLSLLLRQASTVAVMSAGVSILMIMGEIDLSIGSAVYLCGVVAATLQVTYGFGAPGTVVVTVMVGMLMGAWQGAWVVGVAVPSFVVTLAGLLAFRGIGYYATDAATIAPVSNVFSGLSEAFVFPDISFVTLAVVYALAAGYLFRRHSASSSPEGRQPRMVLLFKLGTLAIAFLFLAWIFGGFRGIPAALIWVATCGMVLWVLMSRTIFGRNAYLIGSNREASVLAGVALGRQLFLGFVLMGALYGVAGILVTARLGASTPTTGMYLELDAIAAAVIGGTSLRGGVGTISGAIVGAVLLTTIDNGMSILNISSFIQLVVKGMVLLFALAFDSYVIKRRRA
jgi:D-xylose transport system permease protein